MPQPKGYEPYTRIWTINYRVIVQSHAIAEGTFLSRPRVLIYTDVESAQATYQSLVQTAQVKAGYPAPGTIQQPFLETYRNSRVNLRTFIQEHCDMLNTSS
jgi:hypothetical protein